MRYTTVELGELEQADRRPPPTRPWRWRLALFDDLVKEVTARAEPIARAAAALAALDVAAALAELPRPSAADAGPPVDDSRAFDVAGGRHPVVEAALAAGRQPAPSSPTTARSAPTASASGW